MQKHNAMPAPLIPGKSPSFARFARAWRQGPMQLNEARING